MFASFDDGKFRKDLCPILGIITALWPPEIVRAKLQVVKKDPGDVTGLLEPIAREAEVVLLDSITICGLGYINPSKFKKAIVVSKYVPNIRKAYSAARALYGDEDFEKVAEEYLRRVKCKVRKDGGRLCLAPYGLSEKEAWEIVEERTSVGPLPEDLRMAHHLASALGKYLTRVPSPS